MAHNRQIPDEPEFFDVDLARLTSEARGEADPANAQFAGSVSKCICCFESTDISIKVTMSKSGRETQQRFPIFVCAGCLEEQKFFSAVRVIAWGMLNRLREKS